jgi:7,8-dihydropterin-6-yl-methyl-4-(beta-D-ribofuranosyl)aminobenzene 5'-phosphate synthase
MNILTYVKKNLKKNIYAVIGGTHLEAGDKEQITYVKSALKQFFEQEHTRLFAPNHCTGNRMIAEFKKEFPNIYHDASCGTILEF